jgi:hypothetical protein
MRHAVCWMGALMSKKALWWVVVLNFLSLQLYGLDYSNPELKFKAKLPDKLEDVSSRMRIRGLINLGKWNSSRTGIIKLVSLQDLGGTIGREDLSKRKGKPANATLEKTRWQTFDIDVFRIEESAGKITNVTFNAQVPLKPHAIQVTVMGASAEEASLRREIQAIVTSVQGASSWHD